MNKGEISLEYLENQLKYFSRDVNDPIVRSANMDFIDHIGNNDLITELIKEIVEQDSILDIIAKRSYEHVNHFDKIVLVDNKDPNGYRLTIHYWNGNYSSKILRQELIHNHRFSFWSFIYKGTMRSENFIESSTPSVEKKDFRRYVYRPSKTGNIHTCEYDGKAQLQRLEDIVVDEGNSYFMNFKNTHRVILPETGKGLCTFVLRGPREREHTHTYNTFYPERKTDSIVPMMERDQLKNKLIEILGDSYERT